MNKTLDTIIEQTKNALSSQGALTTAATSIVEAAVGLEPQEIAQARGWGLLAIIGGVYQTTKWVRGKTLDYFNIQTEKQKALHDRILFTIGNIPVSGILYPILAGCDNTETLIMTLATSAAYFIVGKRIGTSIDQAESLDEPKIKERKTKIGRKYANMSARKQLTLNVIISGAIFTGSLFYASTDKEKPLEKIKKNKEITYFEPKQKETTYQNFLLDYTKQSSN